MHHCMPLSKTGWPSLNVVIFPPVTRLVLDDPKQWPPQRFIKFMSQISAKSMAEQLGPSFMKIWTCGSSPRSGPRNAWTRIKNANSASHLSNFWKFFSAIQMIFCCDWWPWTKPGCITMTQRKSNNQWSDSIVAHHAPENSECKNPPENFSPQFFGIKMASSSLIGFQKAKLSMRSITHLCWCNWRTFWRKNAGHGKVTKGVLFLHNNAPAHQAIATQKKLDYLGFQCLDHPPYSPDLAPMDYHLFPGLKKKLKGCHFLPNVEVTAATETWLDGQPSKFFLSGLQKLKQQAKKCTELCGEYVE